MINEHLQFIQRCVAELMVKIVNNQIKGVETEKG
jgi:hypothetical protein